MADLAAERLAAALIFTYVWVDVFWPWFVVASHTRGGQANSKRWTMLFMCMAVRAVHINMIDQMDVSTTINAIRQFFVHRRTSEKTTVRQRHQFMRACNKFTQLMYEEDLPCVQKFLIRERCFWEFNPHTPHTWEGCERG